MFCRTNAIVSSTFLKVVPHAQWRGYGARSPVFSVSFVSFSLRFLRQRKAAKEVWYLKIVSLTIDTKISLTLFSFAIRGTKEKALQKENADFFALTPRGRALLKKRGKTTGGCGEAFEMWTKQQNINQSTPNSRLSSAARANLSASDAFFLSSSSSEFKRGKS